MSLCPLPWFKKKRKKIQESSSLQTRVHGKERQGQKRESFSINFLFNVSASALLWEREDASSRHKFAIIQLDGDSHPQDPGVVFGKIPRWMNSAKSYRVSNRGAIWVHTFEGALVWIERGEAGYLSRSVKFLRGRKTLRLFVFPSIDWSRALYGDNGLLGRCYFVFV